MKLCTISPASYRIARYREEEVWRSHQRIQEFLKFTPHCDEQTLNFLAQPVSKAGRVEWRSDFLQSATPMSTLSPTAKANCEQLVTHTIQQLKLIAQHYPDWAGLLSASLDIASQEDIYYDAVQHRVAVVNWGAKRKGMGNTSAYSFNVAHKASTVPTVMPPREAVQPEDTPHSVDTNPELHPIENVTVTPKFVSATESIEPIPSDSSQEPVLSGESSPSLSLEPMPPSVAPVSVAKPTTEVITPQEETPIPQESHVAITPPPSSLPPASEPVQRPPKPRSFWFRFKRAVWWLLGLILLMLLFLLALSQCEGGRGIPEQPGRYVPIDPDDISYDSDSICQIVGNRVNIYVEEKGRVGEFMESFLKTYSDKDYSILYYDTVVQRVQVQVPEELREQFKQELPTKMQGFKLIVWDETMFTHGTVPSDPGFSVEDEAWYFDCVRAYGAWDRGMGSDSLVVAIVDNGFDLSHPELKDRVVDQYNVLTREHRVYSDKRDPHGTHVAATAVGAVNNATGVSGIAPHCRLMAIQVADDEGRMSTTSVMDGLIYAILHGAKVINLSLGADMASMKIFSEADQVNIMNSFALEEAKVWDKVYAMAEQYGATIVLAGGNDAVLIGLDPMQRSSRAIKVSAIDPKRDVAEFSNYGHLSTISAPGVKIYNAFPGEQYKAINGTSMAAPIVTGGIALIKSKYPQLTTGQIAELIRHTGLPLEANIGPLLQLDKALSVGDTGGDVDKIPDPNAGLPIDETLPPTAPSFPGGPVYRDPGTPPALGDPLSPYYPKPEQPSDSSSSPSMNFPGMPPRPKEPSTPCHDAKHKIDSLRRIISELENICRSETPLDTMRLDEHTTLVELSGYWRSTTDLYASIDNEPVELLFYIKPDGTGTITYHETSTGHSFQAPLAVRLRQSKLNIQQLESARNSERSRESYSQYNFYAEADVSGGIARCYATSPKHTRVRIVKFNMIRMSK